MTAPLGPSRESGFNFIEVLAGMFLTGVMLLAAASVFQTAILNQRLADETTRAATLAAERLEYLVALPFDAPELLPGASTEQLDRRLTRTTLVTEDQPAPGARTIKVTVRREQSSRAVTLVAVRPR